MPNKKNLGERASEVHAALDAEARFVALECVSCETKFLRDREHHLDVSGPDAICHDCFAKGLTGREDVSRLFMGVPGLRFAALVFDVTHNEHAWLTRSHGGIWKFYSRDDFRREFEVESC